MKEDSILNSINKEIKVYINESKAVSIKFRNKIIKFLMKEFNINAKLENYENISVEILENGNLNIRDVEYKRDTPLSIDEIEEAFKRFKEKADPIMKKNEFNYYTMNDGKNILNLFIVLGLIIIAFFLLFYAICAFINGNIFGCIWLIGYISSWLTPIIRERFTQAKNFLKRKLKK